MLNNSDKPMTIMSGLPIKKRKPKNTYEETHYFGENGPYYGRPMGHMHLVQNDPRIWSR